MFHAEARAALAWFAENDQPLSGQNHFLNVMEIEPAQNERLAQGMRIAFLQSRFKDPLPAAEAIEARLNHFTAEADGLVALLPRKPGELAPIFVTSRIMGEKVADGYNTETPQLRAARVGNPPDFT
jgi:hypothetical protein